jgi:hypothetical protein
VILIVAAINEVAEASQSGGDEMGSIGGLNIPIVLETKT